MTTLKGRPTDQQVRPRAPELRLSALIQVNTDLNFATVIVRGALTQTSCDTLIRMVVSTSYLAPNLSMSIDLSEARSVDPEAVKRLGNYPAWSVIEPSPQTAVEGGPHTRANHLPVASESVTTPLVAEGASSERAYPAAASRLAPEEAFPMDLTALDQVQVEVLNSRAGRQVDMEYIRDTQPNPETSTRLEELTEELDRRDRKNQP